MYVPRREFVSSARSHVSFPFQDLRLDSLDSGTRLRVRVSPGAKKEGLLGVYGQALKIAVRAPAEKGRANRAVVDLLADALGVPAARLTVVTGLTSRDKTVSVAGVAPEDLRERLAAAGAASQ